MILCYITDSAARNWLIHGNDSLALEGSLPVRSGILFVIEMHNRSEYKLIRREMKRKECSGLIYRATVKTVANFANRFIHVKVENRYYIPLNSKSPQISETIA
jgi:hypothetical protein